MGLIISKGLKKAFTAFLRLASILLSYLKLDFNVQDMHVKCNKINMQIRLV